jgi:hypothetical protein
MKHLELTSPFWIPTLLVKMVLCQVTYTTNRQINTSTCPQSCHPKRCTKSIQYNQALQIKRICSNEQTTKKRHEELKCHLKKRGYITMLALTIVLTKQVVLTEKISNIEKKEYEQQSAICHHIPSCAQ